MCTYRTATLEPPRVKESCAAGVRVSSTVHRHIIPTMLHGVTIRLRSVRGLSARRSALRCATDVVGFEARRGHRKLDNRMATQLHETQYVLSEKGSSSNHSCSCTQSGQYAEASCSTAFSMSSIRGACTTARRHCDPRTHQAALMYTDTPAQRAGRSTGWGGYPTVKHDRPSSPLSGDRNFMVRHAACDASSPHSWTSRQRRSRAAQRACG